MPINPTNPLEKSYDKPLLRAVPLFCLGNFQDGSGAGLGCFYPDQGTYGFGDATLFANNPTLIVIGNLELERDAVLAFFLGDHYIIRSIDN